MVLRSWTSKDDKGSTSAAVSAFERKACAKAFALVKCLEGSLPFTFRALCKDIRDWRAALVSKDFESANTQEENKCNFICCQSPVAAMNCTCWAWQYFPLIDGMPADILQTLRAISRREHAVARALPRSHRSRACAEDCRSRPQSHSGAAASVSLWRSDAAQVAPPRRCTFAIFESSRTESPLPRQGMPRRLPDRCPPRPTASLQRSRGSYVAGKQLNFVRLRDEIGGDQRRPRERELVELWRWQLHGKLVAQLSGCVARDMGCYMGGLFCRCLRRYLGTLVRGREVLFAAWRDRCAVVRVRRGSTWRDSVCCRARGPEALCANRRGCGGRAKAPRIDDLGLEARAVAQRRKQHARGAEHAERGCMADDEKSGIPECEGAQDLFCSPRGEKT
eukprot:3115283-Pleurochrysis_carterae.AAC.4